MALATKIRTMDWWARASLAVNALFLVVAAMGMRTSLFMNGVGRSLWLDEAMLASSFSKRGFLGILLGGEFEYLQSAPIGWLLFEKALAKALGNTEWVLRFGSFLALAGCVAVLCLLQRSHYKSAFPVAAAALVATIPIVLKYSNMFKPYLCDGLIVLVACGCFAMYLDGRLPLPGLAACWATLVWFAQPACFMIGGLVLGNLAFSLARRDAREVRRSVLLGACVCASFALYYVLWVRRMTDVSEMRDWWEGRYFPLVPTSAEDVRLGISQLSALFAKLDACWPWALACVLLTLPDCIARRDPLRAGIAMGMLVALFASWLHFYPMQDRLWVFAIPPLMLCAVTTFESMSAKSGLGRLVAGCMLLVLALSNSGLAAYRDASSVYISNEEYKTELSYLESHLRQDEKVYVFSSTRAGFEYTNGYGSTSFGGFADNVVFGKGFFLQSDDCGQEVGRVMGLGSCYVVTSHTFGKPMEPDDRMARLIEAMQEEGFLELISYEHETPLWRHCYDKGDAKTRARLSVREVEEGSGAAWIEVENCGEAFIGSPYAKAYLERDDGTLFQLPSMVAPGQTASVRVLLDGGADNAFRLRLDRGRLAIDESVSI